VAHYVKSLADSRNSEGGKAMRAALLSGSGTGTGSDYEVALESRTEFGYNDPVALILHVLVSLLFWVSFLIWRPSRALAIDYSRSNDAGGVPPASRIRKPRDAVALR
jgi:hypothetical protein